MIPMNTYSKKDVMPWMSYIHDDTKISDISIPGTHDSGATHSIFDVSGKCQDLSVKQQLRVGVRFFDLRLQLVNDEFKIVHSFVKQNLSFKKVLKDLSKFIKEYNSEFIIISLKKEESDVNSTLDFKEKLTSDLNEYKDIISFDNVLPEYINDARGKIYIMDRYGLDYGLPLSYWSDDTSFEVNNYYVQDNYCINDINEKKEDIIKAIEYKKTSDNIVINFTSCYLDYGFPPTYAGSSANKINPWFYDYINESNMKLGIVVMDFMTMDLAKAIYMRNYL
jgi:1-phosphatidylinositol phosphodiesterase